MSKEPTEPPARIEAVREHLLAERRRIFARIEAYPPPIPACDAQFNHLLEQRARIADELARLERLPAAAADALADFLRDSPFVDEEDARRLLAGGEA